MVARTTPAETPITLTQENHPENAELKEKPTTITLASSVGIGVLCSLVGMTIGSAALSTAQQSSSPTEVLFLIPLVATTASILGGWVGAFFFMIRSDSTKKND
jgi:hypothetical protein